MEHISRSTNVVKAYHRKIKEYVACSDRLKSSGEHQKTRPNYSRLNRKSTLPYLEKQTANQKVIINIDNKMCRLTKREIIKQIKEKNINK